MVLSFFSSSIMGIFQKTPRSCSLIGSLIFQNPSSPRILGWMATYKPLTIFLKASCIYFPVRGQTELCFSSKSYLIFTCHSNPTPTRYKRGHGRPKWHTTSIYLPIFPGSCCAENRGYYQGRRHENFHCFREDRCCWGRNWSGRNEVSRYFKASTTEWNINCQCRELHVSSHDDCVRVFPFWHLFSSGTLHNLNGHSSCKVFRHDYTSKWLMQYPYRSDLVRQELRFLHRRVMQQHTTSMYVSHFCLFGLRSSRTHT